MSFSHYQFLDVPRSTSIKEDMLHTYRLLDNMEAALSEYENADEATKSEPSKFGVIRNLPERLEQVIKVWNENLTHINSVYPNFKRGLELPTFEQFNNANDHRRSLAYLQQEYQHENAVTQHNYMKRLDEAHNLGQLGLFSSGLKQRIERVIQRSLVQNLPVQDLPKLIPFVQLESHQLLVCESSLRRPRDEVRVIPPTPKILTETPTSSTSSNSSMQSSLEPAVEVSLSQQKIESTTFLLATIRLPLINGTFGICHDPFWDQPVRFASSDEGWKGPIPLNREFKCVIIDNEGKAAEWEICQGNRTIQPDSTLPLRLDAPKFLSVAISEDQTSSFMLERAVLENPSIEEASPQSVAEESLTFSVTVPLSLEEGQILGICHEPDWLEKPVGFTLTSEGWQGQVPFNKEFKYVIIRNDQVEKWENAANRTVKPDSSLPSNMELPKFS